jgi:methyltransferase (TIGR00027 family)
VARLAKGKASRTARMTAAMRARHAAGGIRPRVFEDQFAKLFVDGASLALSIPTPLTDWVVGRVAGPVRALEGEVIARSRYVEEALTAAIAAGTDQIVILGAGFDTTALRHAGKGLRFFEVDHPATQSEKRAVLTANPEAQHDICFVPVDFVTDDLAAALTAAGADPKRPIFCSWLGVVMYLEQAATLATLAALRKIAAPGSQILFDAYPRPEETDRDEQLLFAAARTFTAGLGEPMLGQFDSDAFAKDIGGAGWAIKDRINGEEMRQRWFAGQPRVLHPPKSALFYNLVAV